MASVGVIEQALSFLYVQSSCWMWVVRKGGRLRLGKHWVTSRSSHLLFLWGWVIVDAVGWINFILLLCEGVGTIVLQDGGGSCLCKLLYCRKVVASSM